MQIGGLRVDATGACLVGGPRHRARDRDVLDLVEEHDFLPLLDVRADADHEVCVSLEAFFGSHAREPI